MSSATPTGLWPSLATYTDPAGFDMELWRNPVGVARVIAAIPKVAEYRNLGLWASTTTWLNPPIAFVEHCFGVRSSPQGIRISHDDSPEAAGTLEEMYWLDPGRGGLVF